MRVTPRASCLSGTSPSAGKATAPGAPPQTGNSLNLFPSPPQNNQRNPLLRAGLASLAEELQAAFAPAGLTLAATLSGYREVIDKVNLNTSRRLCHHMIASRRMTCRG
jgi:hypothetical protein